MSIPLFYPAANFVPTLALTAPVSIEQLCNQAGIKCKASGAWTGRQIELAPGAELKITAEPGDWGKVKLEIPPSEPQHEALLALAVLAYGLHDLVAKQSLSGNTRVALAPPRGRPKKARALSTSERQRRFREKRQAKRN